MTKKQRGALCVEALEKEYPDAICSLVYDDPLQLIIAVRLSAQCTDERVNKVWHPTLWLAYAEQHGIAILPKSKIRTRRLRPLAYR